MIGLDPIPHFEATPQAFQFVKPAKDAKRVVRNSAEAFAFVPALGADVKLVKADILALLDMVDASERVKFTFDGSKMTIYAITAGE